MESLAVRLRERRDLGDAEWLEMLESDDPGLAEELHRQAREVARERFGNGIYLRALIEWSNVCRNNCLYCGIRRDNRSVERYTLSPEEILSCCEQAHRLGLRTFVLQGGEQPAAALGLVPVVAEIRASWPDSAITLSLGELPRETYAAFRRSGADRYLLRHETASAAHYARLHPPQMRLENRLSCLRTLRELGFQTGMGMMVGSPYQGLHDLLADLRLIGSFRPEMIGVGPFIPQRDTPLGSFPPGNPALVLKLYSMLRLMLPDALIPSTTALSTLHPQGKLSGILAGANVLMPVFTPPRKRGAYALYDGKPAAERDGAEQLMTLQQQLAAAGYQPSMDRGDHAEHR